jgi:hypothetical protein
LLFLLMQLPRTRAPRVLRPLAIEVYSADSIGRRNTS